jgi:hypothetical protein
MSASITSIHVVLGLPVPSKEVLAYAKTLLGGLTNNPHFPTPSPTLAIFAADVAAYDAAETAAQSRAAGTVTLRNAKRTKVVQDIRHLRDYVQGVVETMTPEDALPAVASAGFRTRKQTAFHKQALKAADGPTTGTVRLTAKAVAKRATYYWEYSLDGKTWTSSPDTMKASTMVPGLTAGQAYSFRFRALTRAGTSDFSQVVLHLVR